MKKWEMVSIESHINILSGFAFNATAFNSDGNGLPIIRVRDVGKAKSNTFYEGDFSESFLINKGDLLVAMDGDFRSSKWEGPQSLLNQRVCKVTPGPYLDVEYLKHFLPKALKEIEDKTPFATVKHLSVKAINKIQIPLPPLPIQRQIAEVLDTADALRQATRQQLAALDELAQGVFLEMFGDVGNNTRHWPETRIEDIVSDIVGGSSYGGDERPLEDDEMGVLKISAVTSGVFKPIYKAVKISDIKQPVIKPCKGDVLFSRANTRELVAATCIVDQDYDRLFLPDKLWRIDIKKDMVNNYFFQAVLSNDLYRPHLTKKATGTSGSMLNISKAKLIDTWFPLPPLPLQTQFAAIIANIEEQKAVLRQSLAESEGLFGGLLQGAFGN